MEFLQEAREHLPFAIQRIQTDNDSSFGPQFTWHLSDLRISHRHIPPGCPEVNGKVERSHKESILSASRPLWFDRRVVTHFLQGYDKWYEGTLVMKGLLVKLTFPQA